MAFVEGAYCRHPGFVSQQHAVTRTRAYSAITPIRTNPRSAIGAQAVPVIRQLAEILDAYRVSIGNPKTGVMFHSGGGDHMDLNRMGQRLVRPAVESLRLEWYGWHACRRGIASNLHELGANEKIV